ncbi:hypothetical protein DY218_29375 [Streptomyces triticagri]|uniref:XRE family transcriptional regulator n=1 Tax=Streptomyces triticagri TaxID=2293568 RepID=A0A372LYM9_9ACTN|nr:hypothetical protein [Streptomyces triticagri]RFU83147.1 hypothetical protein DY218_29375 [Streptomyces triticagri]
MTTAPPPTPPRTDAAAFMAELRRLKAWSGLSYRRLERRAADAGHVLPYSTAATMLGRDRLPRAELVTAFVAACGVTGADAEAWSDARSAIACAAAGPVPPAAPVLQAVQAAQAVQPVSADAGARGWVRRAVGRRRVWAGAAALVVVLVGASAVGGVFEEQQETRQTQTTTVTTGAGRTAG